MGIVISDPKFDPGKTIPSLLREHGFKTFLLISFHLQDDWKMKLFLAKSSETIGTFNIILMFLGLFCSKLKIDMGVLNFNSLNVSRKV